MIIYDSETFPNCYLLCAREGDNSWTFEISSRKNDLAALRQWVSDKRQSIMCGFNNVGFDYPVLHYLLRGGISDPRVIYEYAMSIINTESKYGFFVKPSDYYVPQIDLFKIHHFDNKARSTSLKALEFNMKMLNISDLPFPVGTQLTSPQMDVLIDYCLNDVDATREFYEKTLEPIAFREQLTKQYGQDFTNYNDVKIGKEVFRISLEKEGVTCYNYDPNTGRTPRQTLRSEIRLADCIPSYVMFDEPEFNRIKAYFASKTIYVTKGAFDGLVARVGGLDFVFGTGGLHASVENSHYHADEHNAIVDVDVTSLYPSIAIENGYYPEHLTEKFVDVYRKLRERRVKCPKGTAENAMLKLALNGVYGASNDAYSIFYDPLFTMKITIGGQLMLSMLAERMLTIPGVEIIQVNTDGITAKVPWVVRDRFNGVCMKWEQLTKLNLEAVEYSSMFIADVNSYLAVKTDGGVKRKGRYEYVIGWHQNASSLVVPKVAEQVLVHGKPIRETVENWPDFMDFMMRVKVPRTSTLVGLSNGEERKLENTQRYYMAKGGVELIKIMPPLAKKPDEWRRIAVQKGYTVCPCNNLLDGNLPVDHSWYVAEVEKLCLGVM